MQDLIAVDIINEHAGHESDDDSIPFKGARPGPVTKALALQIICPGCGQGPGEKCQTGAGKDTEPHKRRLDAVDSLSPGS